MHWPWPTLPNWFIVLSPALPHHLPHTTPIRFFVLPSLTSLKPHRSSMWHCLGIVTCMKVTFQFQINWCFSVPYVEGDLNIQAGIPHSLEMYTFGTPTWCSHCSKLLWGFTNQVSLWSRPLSCCAISLWVQKWDIIIHLLWASLVEKKQRNMFHFLHLPYSNYSMLFHTFGKTNVLQGLKVYGEQLWFCLP